LDLLKKMNILISPIGGQVIFSIVEYFKKRGYMVVGIDKNPEAIGKHFVDKFSVVPEVGHKTYMDSIFKIIRENKIDIFISWLDYEILFWNEKFYSSEIPDDLTKIFAFNFSRNLRYLTDKYIFSSLLKNYGFNSPKTLLLMNGNERKINFPVIIKPRISSGTKNVYIVENEEGLKYFYKLIAYRFKETTNFIIQEFVDGTEYTVDFFAQNGKIKNLVVRKRIEHKGVSLRGEIVYNKQIEKLTNRFCSVFNINGLNNIQVIERDNELFLIEYNPRPSGTIMFSINAGVDFLNNVIEQRFGKRITQYRKPKQLKMIRYLVELYYE